MPPHRPNIVRYILAPLREAPRGAIAKSLKATRCDAAGEKRARARLMSIVNVPRGENKAQTDR